MEPLNSKVIPGVHCLKLRTKQMYINATVDPTAPSMYDYSSDGSAYWCVLTQTALGPDRQPVRPDSCCEGRDCCKM